MIDEKIKNYLDQHCMNMVMVDHGQPPKTVRIKLLNMRSATTSSCHKAKLTIKKSVDNDLQILSNATIFPNSYTDCSDVQCEVLALRIRKMTWSEKTFTKNFFDISNQN